MAQSKAHIEANKRYNAKAYDQIRLDLRKDSPLNRDCIRIHAESKGESVAGFIKRAIEETIERDNAETE